MQDTDLAWLAGIWEGEGTILLYSRPVNDKRLQITPYVSVVNTDMGIINKTRKVIEEIGCNFSFREYRDPKGKETYKTRYRLTSANSNQIKIFLEYILPYLFGAKKAYGETLLAFVSRRVEKAKYQKGGLKHLPYDEEDYEFLRSSETTRGKATA